MKYNKITSAGMYTCRICDKKTRDTGHGEESVELCKRCMYECQLENAELDYGIGSVEYNRALAEYEQNKD